MSAPDQAGYIAFIRGVMGIDTSVLPDDSPVIPVSLAVSLEIVSLELAAFVTIYPLAVYNLAGDRLLNYAPDQAGKTFFADARKNYSINTFVAGVIQSAGDEATNESLVVPEQMKELTFMDLQNLKTPYGRTYLQFAQQVGTLWGVS